MSTFNSEPGNRLCNSTPLGKAGGQMAVSRARDQPTATERELTPKMIGTLIFWLVISTHLKNMSQNGNLPQIGAKITNICNHHLVLLVACPPTKKLLHRANAKMIPPDNLQQNCYKVCYSSPRNGAA